MKCCYKGLDIGPARKLLDRHGQHTTSYWVEVDGVTVFMLPGVFCPAYTNTSVFLAQHIEPFPGGDVLDVFSGSGFQAIRAAEWAESVMATDVSDVAVNCIAINIELNRLWEKVRVCKGDLFESVAENRFDVIIANPPLLPAIPENQLEAAILDPDLGITRRFLGEVAAHLTQDGRVYLLFSDVSEKVGLGGIDFVRRHALAGGLTTSVVAEKSVGYETYYVLLLTNAR